MKESEIIISKVYSDKIFEDFLNVLIIQKNAQIIKVLNGLDQRYYDVNINNFLITLHSDIYNGITLFSESRMDKTISLIIKACMDSIYPNIKSLCNGFPGTSKSFIQLINEFILKNYSYVNHKPFISRCNPQDIERTILEYGKSLEAIPLNEIENTEIGTYNDCSGFYGDFQLWTLEEGVSDLSLIFSIHNDSIEIEDIHVM